jgi:hypothetical protein
VETPGTPAGRQRCPWHTPEVIPTIVFYKTIFEGKKHLSQENKSFSRNYFQKDFWKIADNMNSNM